MICQVETHSGFRLHERPRRFTWQGAWLEVTRVLEQWYDPEHLNFAILAADGAVYILTYRITQDEWQVARK